MTDQSGAVEAHDEGLREALEQAGRELALQLRERKPLAAIASLDGTVTAPLVCLTPDERDSLVAAALAQPAKEPSAAGAAGQGDMICEEIVGMLRESAKRVFGGNCTFADDDLARLEAAARAHTCQDAGGAREEAARLHPYTVPDQLRFVEGAEWAAARSGQQARGGEALREALEPMRATVEAVRAEHGVRLGGGFRVGLKLTEAEAILAAFDASEAPPHAVESEG